MNQDGVEPGDDVGERMETDDDWDVFGHGGSLDEGVQMPRSVRRRFTVDTDPRLEPIGHGAGSGHGSRAEPCRHAAATTYIGDGGFGVDTDCEENVSHEAIADVREAEASQGNLSADTSEPAEGSRAERRCQTRIRR